MNTLSKELDRYLTVRRGLGYNLGSAERILRKFLLFAASKRADHVSTDLFLRWQKEFGHAGLGTWAARLSIVRLFAQWLHGLDPRHEVPPRSLIPGRHRRSRPYIYSPAQIEHLIQAAGKLPSVNGIRRLTYATVFGLIAATGLRISEAIALDGDDVDLKTGVLTVRHGKRGRERLVPVALSTMDQLNAYAQRRDRLLGRRPEPFFISDAGRRLTDCALRYNFALVCQRIGLRPAQRFYKHGRGPRVHDLRHTFAVHTMVNWYRADKDVDREMIRLTTYLGHQKPAHTYWYIQAVPELLDLARARSEAFWQHGDRP